MLTVSKGLLSVREKAAELAPAEAVVSRLVVGIVGDHTVVAGLASHMSDNFWAHVIATIALRHGAILLRLHLGHALLCLAHVGSMFIILSSLVGLATDKLKEALTLLGSGGLICRRFIA